MENNQNALKPSKNWQDGQRNQMENKEWGKGLNLPVV